MRSYIDQLSHEILSGNRRSLSKGITLLESRNPAHRNQADRLLETLLPHSGQSKRLGITGVPGVGKSTFIESLGCLLIENGHRIAVLAVDPSSNLHQGSILGDKTRMPRLATHDACFVRPSPTGGELGGVAAMSREAMILCEAAGHDVILVETVGVGQSELAVSEMVDFFLALMLPGAGDDLQGLKKGIIEIADAIVINKADGDQRELAELARQHYQKALSIIEPIDPEYPTKVMLVSGLLGHGLNDLWDQIDKRLIRSSTEGHLARRRQEQSISWFNREFERRLSQYVSEIEGFESKHSELKLSVRDHKLSASQAAMELIKHIENSKS